MGLSKETLELLNDTCGTGELTLKYAVRLEVDNIGVKYTMVEYVTRDDILKYVIPSKLINKLLKRFIKRKSLVAFLRDNSVEDIVASPLQELRIDDTLIDRTFDFTSILETDECTSGFITANLSNRDIRRILDKKYKHSFDTPTKNDAATHTGLTFFLDGTVDYDGTGDVVGKLQIESNGVASRLAIGGRIAVLPNTLTRPRINIAVRAIETSETMHPNKNSIYIVIGDGTVYRKEQKSKMPLGYK